MISATLLDTAVDQFGMLGFEGASTRDIARASNTAMSSITYHFGGKKGLYLAAADHIAASIRDTQGPALTTAQVSVCGTREEAMEAILAMLDSLAEMMMRPESEAWARFIIREQQAPTEAFERLYQGAMCTVIDTFVALVSRVRDDMDPLNARVAGVLLFGQALMLRAGRTTVCRVMGVDEIDEAASILLRAQLRSNAIHILSNAH